MVVVVVVVVVAEAAVVAAAAAAVVAVVVAVVVVVVVGGGGGSSSSSSTSSSSSSKCLYLKRDTCTVYTTLSLCHKHLTHAVRLAGPVTNDLLRHVAQQLAADDWRRMAPILNIRRTRLQAILRQNVGSPAWLPIYDVLLTWSKRLPQAFDRVRLGCGYWFKPNVCHM